MQVQFRVYDDQGDHREVLCDQIMTLPRMSISEVQKLMLLSASEFMERVCGEKGVVNTKPTNLCALRLDSVPLAGSIGSNGSNKIYAIKALRTATGLALKEAKDLVEGPMGVTIIQSGDKEFIEKAATIMRNEGYCTVSMIPVVSDTEIEW